MKSTDKQFHDMVDELVLFSKYDPELADGIAWLDEQARKKGVQFYEMTFDVLYKHDVNESAKMWNQDRSYMYDEQQ